MGSTWGEMAVVFQRSEQDIADDEWYIAIGDALRILGKRWYDDFTKDEDAFILAYADIMAQRPAHEMPCGPCSSAAGHEIVHGILECPSRLAGQ
jgi:hypothetical protein